MMFEKQFLLNSHGMDIEMKINSLSYKILGGVLDFYFLAGPTANDVVKQYSQVVGTPALPPYWALGFHQCRYGYQNVDQVRDVVDNYRRHNLPLETMWTDIDYMDQNMDFTLDPINFPQHKMKNLVDDLHSRHQHYVLIIDPAIKKKSGYAPYDDGIKKDIFLKNPDQSIFQGEVWPGQTVFPDFQHPATQSWWTYWIKDFMKTVDIDGLWIDMNEVSNFCDGDCRPEKKSHHPGPSYRKFKCTYIIKNMFIFFLNYKFEI